MIDNINDEVLLNLKNKINAIIEKGDELSKDLSNDDKYDVMKKLIHEGINKAISNIYKDDELKFSEQDLKEKKEELERFVQEYFDKKFSEKIAIDWENKMKS
ncbi:MAG: hypothetical protein JRJ27_12120 [Deltaproteobacteria bacterium]|nr:hypothetical protein [Deltaproteobacteria bacterium]